MTEEQKKEITELVKSNLEIQVESDRGFGSDPYSFTIKLIWDGEWR